MGRFETSEQASARWHQPVRVPRVKADIFGAAREMAADMPGWTLTKVDEEALCLEATKKNGFLEEYEAAIIFRQLIDTIIYLNN